LATEDTKEAKIRSISKNHVEKLRVFLHYQLMAMNTEYGHIQGIDLSGNSLNYWDENMLLLIDIPSLEELNLWSNKYPIKMMMAQVAFNSIPSYHSSR